MSPKARRRRVSGAAVRRERQAARDKLNAGIDQTRKNLELPLVENESPQSRYHYTVSDQLTALAAIRGTDPIIGFTNRVLVVCALPRTNKARRSASTG